MGKTVSRRCHGNASSASEGKRLRVLSVFASVLLLRQQRRRALVNVQGTETSSQFFAISVHYSDALVLEGRL